MNSKTNTLLTIEPKFNTRHHCELLKVNAMEGINQDFEYKLEIICANTALNTKDVLGQALSFSVQEKQNTTWKPLKTYHGCIHGFKAKELLKYEFRQQTLQLRRYELVLKPNLTQLSHTFHNRIFQKSGQKSMDIVEALLSYYHIDFENKITNSPEKNYCVQYQCSDLELIERLLAECGAYYYYVHTKDKHTLIIANTNKDYVDSQLSLSHRSDKGRCANITDWHTSYTMAASIVASSDYNPSQPSHNLYKKTKVQQLQTTKAPLVDFIYPGQFQSSAAGSRAVQHYAEQLEGHICDTYVKTNCRQLAAGSIFNVTGAYFKDSSQKQWLIKTVYWQAHEARAVNNRDGVNQAVTYQAKATLVPANVVVAISKARIIPPPIQLATVVNSQGKVDASEPVYTDEQGRICIQFHWEKYDDAGLNSNHFDTCLIPSMHQWSNGVYRVGTPVLVGFFQDIDHPVVLGPVNNAQHLLQGKYTTNNQQSSMLKQWPGANDGTNYNAIQFNDEKDKELLHVFAGKDMQTVVNEGDQSLDVSKGKRNIRVADIETHNNKKDYNHNIDGKRETTVKGDETYINEENFKKTVKGKYVLKVDGDLEFDVSGGITIKSSQDLNLSGMSTKIKSTENTDISGLMVNVSSDVGVKLS